MGTDMVHHYTDIRTLALILRNRTIRFNRLDQVDDITEGDAFTRLKLEKFFFVSCWTQDREESLPQWNMYTTDMAGVRISLPKRLFKYQPLVIPTGRENIEHPNFISPIPFERIFADNYLILPNFLSEEHFGRAVVYVDDFIERKNDAIKVSVDPNGVFEAQINDPTGIAALKSRAWAFQNEFRFVLFILPPVPLQSGTIFSKEFSDRIANVAASSLYHGRGPNFDFFDVDMDPLVLRSEIVTTGPLCTEGDRLIVESLMEKYAPSASVESSKFQGTIRRPRRCWGST